MNSKQSELNPELAQYIERMENGGLYMMRHPLVFSVPYFDHPEENERLNTLFEFKLSQIKNANKNKDWGSYVFSHERPYRAQALRDAFDDIPDGPEKYDLIRQVYVDTENLHQNLEWWKDILFDLIGKDVWNSVASLPRSITVYRGGTEDGISWTNNLETALWFAKRWNANLPVWTGVVSRDRIVGYLDDRGEHEVVVFPEYVTKMQQYVVDNTT